MVLTRVALFLVLVAALFGMRPPLLFFFPLYLFLFKLPVGMHMQHMSPLEDSEMLQRFIRQREGSMYGLTEEQERRRSTRGMIKQRRGGVINHITRI